MSTLPDSDDSRQSDVFDRIAKDLPPDLQAEYYRELIHCRSLPENDEVLRVIRILQILTYLIQTAPETVVQERAQIEAACQRLTEALHKAIGATKSYHADLDNRLAHLPEQIASGIQPEAIARAIFESLRQEFVRSGIPQMSQPLQVVAMDLKKTAGQLQNAASTVDDAGQVVVRRMYQTQATFTLESKQLTERCTWLRVGFWALLIVISFVAGMWYEGELVMHHLSERDSAANMESAHRESQPTEPKKSR